MQLKNLYVKRNDKWEANAGALSGHVTFENEHGDIKLNLSAASAERIVALCAEGMLEESRTIAERMTVNILDGVAVMQLIAPAGAGGSGNGESRSPAIDG